MPDIHLGPDQARGARLGGHVQGMQRRRLLLAAVEIAGEDGLRDVSVAQVCKRAGVSRRTFYELFDSREDCLLEAFQVVCERIGRSVAAAYGGDGDWAARIRRGLIALLGHFDAEPDVARMCVIETANAGPRVVEERMRVFGALLGAVEDGRAESRSPEPPPLTGQVVVGGVLSVIQSCLLEPKSDDSRASLTELAGELTAMVVHPYLGSAAAKREILRSAVESQQTTISSKDPFKGLSIRFTYRTARVLATIAAGPGASNRWIADTSGIADEGQMSRLLARLRRAGLVENSGEGQLKGEPNAWTLTERGHAIQAVLAAR